MKRFTQLLAAAAVLASAAVASACPMHGGEIVNINRDTNRVTVVKGDDLATFRVDPQKSRNTLGKQATLAELKRGDTVNVNYDMNEQVTKIQVTRGS